VKPPYIIVNLQDEAYTISLNRLLPGRSKFSLAESKVKTLVEALRRAQDFIQATEICVRDDFVQPDNRKREREDKGLPADKCPRKVDERIGHLHTTPRNIFMEIKGNPAKVPEAH